MIIMRIIYNHDHYHDENNDISDGSDSSSNCNNHSDSTNNDNFYPCYNNDVDAK